jgi:hypothetical protein
MKIFNCYATKSANRPDKGITNLGIVKIASYLEARRRVYIAMWAWGKVSIVPVLTIRALKQIVRNVFIVNTEYDYDGESEYIHDADRLTRGKIWSKSVSNSNYNGGYICTTWFGRSKFIHTDRED